MTKNTIITIGRQFGSGGREIGETLAKELSIPFYDKELILLAAEKSGMNADIVKDVDEKSEGSLLYSLSTGIGALGRGTFSAYTMPLSDRLFIVQSEIIKQVSEAGPCVIVGRCADYVLDDNPNCINIFIHANIENRLARCMELYQLSKKSALELITKTDKKRAAYYSYYTDRKWGKVENYHLSICSSDIGVRGAVEVIKTYVKLRAEK